MPEVRSNSGSAAVYAARKPPETMVFTCADAADGRRSSASAAAAAGRRLIGMSFLLARSASDALLRHRSVLKLFRLFAFMAVPQQGHVIGRANDSRAVCPATILSRPYLKLDVDERVSFAQNLAARKEQSHVRSLLVRRGPALALVSGLCMTVVSAQTGAKNGEWRTWGGDLGSTGYARSTRSTRATSTRWRWPGNSRPSTSGPVRTSTSRRRR